MESFEKIMVGIKLQDQTVRASCSSNRIGQVFIQAQSDLFVVTLISTHPSS